jgi:dolichyl-diphosphooligosaccharide--protein glycosyltransferase
MAVLSYFMTRRSVKPVIYPAAIVGLGLISLVIFRIATPSLFQAMIGRLDIFTWPTETTVYEMRPLLFPFGSFSWSIAWSNFNTSFFLCFIALGMLIYSIVKRGESGRTLLVIWSLVILAAALSMRRFSYYFAVNAALLVGYLSWMLLEFSGFRRLTTVPAEAPKGVERKVRDKKKWRVERRYVANRIDMVLGVIVVFFLVFYPNIGPLPGGKKPVIDVASNPQFVPSDAWCESLSWMRDNTPDPFNNPDFYYELYQPPPPGERYGYPQTAYGVTAWWDYGYWITRIGRRIPTSNPGTGHRGESRLFTAQDEEKANKILDRWGSKYVIVDYAIANAWSGKFYALAKLSHSKKENFFDIYYQPQKGVLKPVTLFYPEYYRSLVCRLYNFNGKQVVPRNSVVISYEQKVNKEGQPYREITGAKSFSTYGEAEAYITAQKSDNYRIVGSDPFVSPVPLEALEHYKLVYSSEGTVVQPDGKLVSEVKIFEYIE